MLSDRTQIEDVKTAVDGVNELRHVAYRAALAAERGAQRMNAIVAEHGRAALVAELEVGEGPEFLALFNALKNIAETYKADTVVEDLAE